MIRFGSIIIFRYVPDTSSVSETLNGLTSIDELQFWRAHVRSLNLKLLSEYKIPTVVVQGDP